MCIWYVIHVYNLDCFVTCNGRYNPFNNPLDIYLNRRIMDTPYVTGTCEKPRNLVSRVRPLRHLGCNHIRHQG